MSIRSRLWRVLEREGYGSIEEMARRECAKHNLDLPAGTLYSWMTRRSIHRRLRLTPSSVRIVSLITGATPGEIMEDMMAEDAHATSAVR